MKNNLCEVRKKSGYTQYDMAKRLNISIAAYNQYENGNRSVPFEIVKKICEILNVNKDEIFLPKTFTVSKTVSQQWQSGVILLVKVWEKK